MKTRSGLVRCAGKRAHVNCEHVYWPAAAVVNLAERREAALSSSFQRRTSRSKRENVESRVRRRQLAVIPALAMTAYAAQGNAWHAVIVDLDATTPHNTVYFLAQ